MLSKKNRLDKKGVDKVFLEGRFINSSFLTFKFLSTKDQHSPHISFIAPKSVAKFAVNRNILRRRGYTALKKYINQFPSGLLGAFIFKRYQDDVLILEDEIKEILNKIN